MTAVSDRDQNLLCQIEQAILDDSTTTTSILQKYIILGGRAGSTELREWAAKELRGYELDDELPSHRTVNAIMHIDGQAGPYLIKDQIIGNEDLPEVVRETASYDNTRQFRQGLGELEAHADRDNDTVRITPETGSQIVKMIKAALCRRQSQALARCAACGWRLVPARPAAALMHRVTLATPRAIAYTGRTNVPATTP